MKRILYLIFYYEPDLFAGSIRNSPFKEFCEQFGANGTTAALNSILKNVRSLATQHSRMVSTLNF